jgi:group I intron endonuclease
MNKYKVYKHTSPSNKVYIGITKVNVKKRWNFGRGYCKNTHFYNAIIKYGWDNFKHEILFENLSLEEAKKKEIELISYYKSNNILYGYNQTQGGDYRLPMPEESKKKMIECLKGRVITEEQREHYRQGASKRPKREKLSDTHKKNISKSLIGNKRALGKTQNRKQIFQYTIDGHFVKKYSCAGEAAIELNCDKSGINTAARENSSDFVESTKYKGIYKNFRWSYEYTEKWADKLVNIKR